MALELTRSAFSFWLLWAFEIPNGDVRNRIPGIVDSDEEQKESRRTDYEKNSLRIAREQDCRDQ
jgi:hypothetical protein